MIYWVKTSCLDLAHSGSHVKHPINLQGILYGILQSIRYWNTFVVVVAQVFVHSKSARLSSPWLPAQTKTSDMHPH